MAKQKTLEDAFYETLKDVYYAEKASVKALKKSARAAQSTDLRQAFETHAEESAGQIRPSRPYSASNSGRTAVFPIAASSSHALAARRDGL